MTLIIWWLLFGMGLPVVLLAYIYYMRSKVVAVAPSEQPQDAAVAARGGLFTGWIQRYGIVPDLVWIMAYTLISSLAYSILSRSDYFNIDLSYIWPPLVVALQIGIAARLVRIFAPVPWNRYGFHLLNGAAIIYFVYIILGRYEHVADTIAFYFGGGSSSRVYSMLENLEKIAQSRLYFVMGISAITVYLALPFIHEISSKWSKWKDLVLAVSLGLVAYGLFAVLDSFSSGLAEMTSVGWVIFAGVMAIALGTIMRYGRNLQDALISEICIWLSSSKIRMFIIGVAVASYVMFLRPYLFGLVKWSTSLIEWAVFCFVVWRLYDGIRGRISDTYSVQLKYTSWKKHMQRVQKQIDSDFSYATNLQSDFIERSHKDQLLVYLVTLMHGNGMSIEEISQVLHPLAEQHDESIPVFSFTKTRNIIGKRNRENREQILKEIMNELRERDIQTE